MKAKKRAAIQEAVDAAIFLGKSRPEFHVLSVRFADGKSIEIPFLPWKPRTEINLPGRYEVEP